MSLTIWQSYRSCWIIQKSGKCIFEWSKEPKKEVFDHFLESGLLDRLDVAYCDCTKCLPTFGNVTRSSWIIQKSQKCNFEWSKCPKRRFLTIVLSLVCWIDLILHIVIVLNVNQLSAMLPGHEGSFKIYKKASWIAQRDKKEFFGRFLSLVGLIGLVNKSRRQRSQISHSCQWSQRSQRSQRMLSF